MGKAEMMLDSVLHPPKGVLCTVPAAQAVQSGFMEPQRTDPEGIVYGTWRAVFA